MWIIQVLVGLVMGIICIFYVSQIYLPLFYCIPKSIYLVLRGELRPPAIFIWLWAPLIWLAIPFLIGFFFPSIIETSLVRFLDNPISGIVTNLMVAGLILSTIFTRKRRADAKEDFWNSMKNSGLLGQLIKLNQKILERHCILMMLLKCMKLKITLELLKNST